MRVSHFFAPCLGRDEIDANVTYDWMKLSFSFKPDFRTTIFEVRDSHLIQAAAPTHHTGMMIKEFSTGH